MQTDLDIARQAELRPIREIVQQLDLADDEWESFGKYKAKLSLNVLERLEEQKSGNLILVTSINPTPAGEGKSTVTVGLGQALQKIGKKTMIALREPSLGPVMGIKGGATGGGYAQVVPMDEINLHFTGDMHAITTANNALAAFIDNHLFQGNACGLDPRRITWKRVLDLNDRALREVIVGLGGPKQGVPRQDGFNITVASEIMAILCLAQSYQDLRERLAQIVVGYRHDQTPVTVKDLGYQGALTLLLKDAFKPNLVQTIEGVPALIHGGPFANIAHGCNSIIATKMASKLADYVVTEAGFGADLGAEKFLNIKARVGKLDPKAVVIVATIRALKMHGGASKNQLDQENVQALSKGIDNLAKHIETIQSFGLPFVVALNQFTTDTSKEIKTIQAWCEQHQVPIALTTVWGDGGLGGIELAEQLVKIIDREHPHYHPLYSLEASLSAKIETIAKNVYGANRVIFSDLAKQQLSEFEQNGWSNLPVCMAKTQYSLSDQPERLGRPRDFNLTIRELRPSIGAGFIVALTGEVLTMPGLPAEPAALNMDLDQTGRALGLF
ncbi:formate--tetrahydrofolate ligase [Amphibacillus sediminis]|uniref:formate--tetrahydrofolate ligase n=1 Tax=Amphibacillus sediminis TaxID=360185 RepID=UPI00082AB99F|nr:formate--tetrahydrofolate ligase [Amphibacillus sediminis]